MKYEEVYSYVYDKASYFPAGAADDLMGMLIDCDEEAFEKIKKTHLKSPTLIQLVSVFLGIYGIDRLLIKDYTLGLLKMFTGGGFLCLWIYDIFHIRSEVKDFNYIKIKCMAVPSLEAIMRNVSPK